MHSMGRRHRTVEHYRKIPNPFRRESLRALDALDLCVYIIVGTSFVIAAAMALGFSLLNLANSVGIKTPSINFGETLLTFISDLLLVLIIMEVLGTVRSYLEHGDTSVKPFIFIGIISGTRGVLSIGARLSIAGTNISTDEFWRSMVELGVNAAIIIALGATLRIMGGTAQADEIDSDIAPSPLHRHKAKQGTQSSEHAVESSHAHSASAEPVSVHAQYQSEDTRPPLPN